MGMFDLFCPLCGGPCSTPPEDVALKITDDVDTLKWLGELVAIREGQEPFFGREDGYGRVESEGEEVNVYEDDAIGLHVRCWQLLNKPDHDWLLDHKIIGSNSKSPFISDQFFDWESFVEDQNDLWAAIDPLKNNDSMNRIQKIIAGYSKAKPSTKSPKFTPKSPRSPRSPRSSTVAAMLPPPLPKSKARLPIIVPGSKAVSTQNRCQGITKQGLRCSRAAQTGSKFCFQHK